jgi:hypothetical protein
VHDATLPAKRKNTNISQLNFVQLKRTNNTLRSCIVFPSSDHYRLGRMGGLCEMELMLTELAILEGHTNRDGLTTDNLFAHFSSACGVWVRMPCSPGTTFQMALQICLAPMREFASNKRVARLFQPSPTRVPSNRHPCAAVHRRLRPWRSPCVPAPHRVSSRPTRVANNKSSNSPSFRNNPVSSGRETMDKSVLQSRPPAQ